VCAMGCAVGVRRGYDIPSIVFVSPGAIAAVCLHAVVGSVHVVLLLHTSLSYIVTFTFFQCVCILGSHSRYVQ